jgi:hypothetical protein
LGDDESWLIVLIVGLLLAFVLLLTGGLLVRLASQ